eukprot:jgi/Mesvir1/22750/Mv14150-RA.1
MDTHIFQKCFMQILYLAGAGVLINMALNAILIKFILPYDWGWNISLMFGSLLSATDPVAVVALLKELGASKVLGHIVDGEALGNDGTSIVVFNLFFNMALGTSYSAGEIVAYFFRVCLGGPALGILFAIVAVLWLAFIYHDAMVEITITFVACYMVFFVAENEAKMSGVLAVMALGITMGFLARTAFVGEVEHVLHAVWDTVEYMANTLIFVLAGIIMGSTFVEHTGQLEAVDWGWLVVLYLGLNITRALTIGVLFPLLARSGYGMNWKEALITTWSGLRGAVALALALVVEQEEGFEPRIRSRILFFTCGVGVLTLLINGSSAQYLLAALGMNKPSEAKERILEYTEEEMRVRAVQAFKSLSADDTSLGMADFNVVQKYITILHQNPGEQDASVPGSALLTMRSVHALQSGHVADDAEFAADVQAAYLQMDLIRDLRVRFLQSLKSAYWEMLEEGYLPQPVAIVLTRSVDHALDCQDRLADWDAVHYLTGVPYWLHFLQKHASRLSLHRLVQSILFRRLELSCSMAAAFVEGHFVARRELEEFTKGQPAEQARNILQESSAECLLADAFLADIRGTFPQVLRSIKTKQVTHAILFQSKKYVEKLRTAGLLEDREISGLTTMLDADTKRLFRSPPVVDYLPPSKMLRRQPLVRKLPTEDLVNLVVSTACERDIPSTRPVVLLDKGVEGAHLLCSGRVQVTDAHGHEARYPLGNVLGLYEAMAGHKTYLMTCTATSFLQTCLLETKVIHQLMQNETAAEVMWKMAALPVCEVLLGTFFKEMARWEIQTRLGLGILESYIGGDTLAVESDGDALLLLHGRVAVNNAEYRAPLLLMHMGMVMPEGTVTTGGRYAAVVACKALVLMGLTHELEEAFRDTEAVAPNPQRSRQLAMDAVEQWQAAMGAMGLDTPSILQSTSTFSHPHAQRTVGYPLAGSLFAGSKDSESTLPRNLQTVRKRSLNDPAQAPKVGALSPSSATASGAHSAGPAGRTLKGAKRAWQQEWRRQHPFSSASPHTSSLTMGALPVFSQAKLNQLFPRKEDTGSMSPKRESPVRSHSPAVRTKLGTVNAGTTPTASAPAHKPSDEDETVDWVFEAEATIGREGGQGLKAPNKPTPSARGSPRTSQLASGQQPAAPRGKSLLASLFVDVPKAEVPKANVPKAEGEAVGDTGAHAASGKGSMPAPNGPAGNQAAARAAALHPISTVRVASSSGLQPRTPASVGAHQAVQTPTSVDVDLDYQKFLQES